MNGHPADGKPIQEIRVSHKNTHACTHTHMYTADTNHMYNIPGLVANPSPQLWRVWGEGLPGSSMRLGCRESRQHGCAKK